VACQGLAGRFATGHDVGVLLSTAALAVTLTLLGTPALAGPSDGALLAAGGAMAVPTYFLFVALHEGTHALAAHQLGAEITAMHLLPGMRDGHFFFGYTDWRGVMTPGELSLVLVAPKVTDAVVLLAYGVAVAAGGLPANRFGALALTVLASGAWVDFTKDVIAVGPMNDIIRIHALAGRTGERQRWPYRLLHAGLAALAAVPIAVGYRDIFRSPAEAAVMLPLVAAPF
jgi:hypothetical protein